MKQKIHILIAISFFTLWQAPSVWSDTSPDAEAVVISATKAIYQVIQEQCEEIEKNPFHLHKLVEDILIPHADFTRMAQLAVGKHWRSLDDNQRSEFVSQFRQLLTRTYATAVQMASLQAINYLPSRVTEKSDTVVVRTEVRRPGEALVKINYRLYPTNGVWRVYDIVVDGVSLVGNYRTAFADEIKNQGVSGLLELLQKKNQQPIVETNAERIRKRAIRACK